ncbi:MAG: DNA-packaging protein FI [Plesiomonas shigelloides]
MSQKEDLIHELTQLGQALGRKITATGTAAELQQRVNEAKAELNELMESVDDEFSDDSIHTAPSASGELVCIEALVTLHIDATELHSDQKLPLVLSGQHCRIDSMWVDMLVGKQLINVV